MSNRGLLALVALSSALFTGAALATPPIVIPLQQDGVTSPGTQEPCIDNNCLFYAGDFDSNGPNPVGLWNQVANINGVVIDGTVYVPFTVPRRYKGAKGRTDWGVTGLFGNIQNYPSPSATQVTWSIVTGAIAGGNPSKATVVCSGTSAFTTTATGRAGLYSGTSYQELTYLVTGITSCPTLASGTYWMTVVPQVTSPPNGFEYNYLSDVEDVSPPNLVGPGSEPVDDSLFISQFFGQTSFTLANSANVCGPVGCDEFSVGVIGTASH